MIELKSLKKLSVLFVVLQIISIFLFSVSTLILLHLSLVLIKNKRFINEI